MKMFLLAAAAGWALSGCSSGPDRIDPHGNYPDAKTGNVEPSGTLSVRGMTEPIEDTSAYGRYDPLPAPLYTVYDSNGNFIRESRAGMTDLAPGRYLIRVSEAAGNEKKAAFWVTIESGKTTYVDAERIQEPSKANVN